MSRVIFLILIGASTACFGQVGGPPGPGEWHVTICSVEVLRTCIEASNRERECRDAPNSCTPLLECSKDEGIRMKNGVSDLDTYKQASPTLTETQPGFYYWKFEKSNVVCGFIQTCECEPPGSARPGKCRTLPDSEVDFSPLIWTYDPMYVCP